MSSPPRAAGGNLNTRKQDMADNDNATEQQTSETKGCPDCAGLGAQNGQGDCTTCNGTGRVAK